MSAATTKPVTISPESDAAAPCLPGSEWFCTVDASWEGGNVLSGDPPKQCRPEWVEHVKQLEAQLASESAMPVEHVKSDDSDAEATLEHATR